MQILASVHSGGAVLGDFESIATVSVGAGGSNGSVTFSSIPQTYKHLQVRALARTDRASTFDGAYFYLNSDTTLSNYTLHGLRGDGASASSFGFSTSGGTGTQSPTLPGNSLTSEIFGVFILDILDYTNTNKNTTMRAAGGLDYNGGGRFDLISGVWLNTAAVTAISFASASGTEFLQYSHFALYGIKG